ncbi:MAG: hypothetical protein AB1512_18205 [Thermodesulfobacteriota bacterium]
MPLLSTRKRFGALAVEKGFVTLDQVIEGISIQARENIEGKGNRLLGEILRELGYITTSQVYEVLETRFEPRFGEAAVTRGFLTVEQLIQAMSVQVRDEVLNGRHRLLGEIVTELGLMDAEEVKQVLKDIKSGKR